MDIMLTVLLCLHLCIIKLTLLCFSASQFTLPSCFSLKVFLDLDNFKNDRLLGRKSTPLKIAKIEKHWLNSVFEKSGSTPGQTKWSRSNITSSKWDHLIDLKRGRFDSRLDYSILTQFNEWNSDLICHCTHILGQQ